MRPSRQLHYSGLQEVDALEKSGTQTDASETSKFPEGLTFQEEHVLLHGMPDSDQIPRLSREATGEDKSAGEKLYEKLEEQAEQSTGVGLSIEDERVVASYTWKF